MADYIADHIFITTGAIVTAAVFFFYNITRKRPTVFSVMGTSFFGAALGYWIGRQITIDRLPTVDPLWYYQNASNEAEIAVGALLGMLGGILGVILAHGLVLRFNSAVARQVQPTADTSRQVTARSPEPSTFWRNSVGIILIVIVGIKTVIPMSVFFPLSPRGQFALDQSTAVTPNTLTPHLTKSWILDRLGVPTSRIEPDTVFPWHWYYALRETGLGLEGDYTRAVILRITFDRNQRLSAWGFFHPLTNERLTYHESRRQSQYWLEAYCPNSAEIELSRLLKSHVTVDEVMVGLRVKGLPGYEQLIIHQPDGTLQLAVPVDHPGPLYMPAARFLNLEFDQSGRLTDWNVEERCLLRLS